MPKRKPPTRRVDLSGLLRRARDQGWTIRVLNRVTVACTHPEAGELVVSALFVRPGGRRLLDAELQQPDAAKEPTAERQLAVWINPDLMRL